jgi:hypothetical protein
MGLVLPLAWPLGNPFMGSWNAWKGNRFSKSLHLRNSSHSLIFWQSPHFTNVIVPIESSGSFIEVLNKAGATHLRVVNDKLDKRFANASRSAAQTFRQVISKSEIPEFLLTYATMKQFAGAAIRNYTEGEK